MAHEEGRIATLEKGQEVLERNMSAVWENVNALNKYKDNMEGSMKAVKNVGWVIVTLNALILLLGTLQVLIKK